MIFDTFIEKHSKVTLNEASYKQHELCSKEIEKLNEISNDRTGWGLIHEKFFEKITIYNFCEGVVIGCGGCCIGMLLDAWFKRRKIKKDSNVQEEGS